MKRPSVIWVVLMLLTAPSLTAAGLEDRAAMDGLALAADLTSRIPDKPLTNHGVLTIRAKRQEPVKLPVTIVMRPDGDTWTTTYETRHGGKIETFTIHQGVDGPNRYTWTQAGGIVSVSSSNATLRADQLMRPFAGSDFWLADLGLEFLHWPGQKLLRKELRRGQSCHVLESTLHGASDRGYARVVAWIDIDTGGIVDAYAYDSQGRELKHFYPRSFQKINGRYEIKRIDISSSQDGSVTTLQFDPPR